jgi:hypothetical protein
MSSSSGVFSKGWVERLVLSFWKRREVFQHCFVGASHKSVLPQVPVSESPAV